MFGSSVGSRHEDLLSATPETDELKRHLVAEIKNRAKGVVGSKNFPEAIELYSKAIEVIPENETAEKSVLYANRSMCHSGMGKFSEAHSDAELSINLNPAYTKAYFRKTTALIGLHKYKEAKECVTIGLEQMPGDKELSALLTKVDAELKKAAPASSSTDAKASAPKATTKVTATKKKATDSSEDATEEEEEVNVDKEVVRGYKKLPDGRVTTFFNNTLDEQTKALIGDIAPKKLDSAAALPAENGNVVGSSWNSAGTFESRDLTSWAKPWLQNHLSNEFLGGPLPGSLSSASLLVKELKDLNGDAEIIVTRGKRKYVCDFSFTVVFQISLKSADGSEKLVDASLLVEDVTADLGYESSFTVTTKVDANEPALKAGKTELSNRLKTQLELFVQELKSKT